MVKTKIKYKCLYFKFVVNLIFDILNLKLLYKN